jgi:hypothetical protein
MSTTLGPSSNGNTQTESFNKINQYRKTMTTTTNLVNNGFSPSVPNENRKSIRMDFSLDSYKKSMSKKSKALLDISYLYLFRFSR